MAQPLLSGLHCSRWLYGIAARPLATAATTTTTTTSTSTATTLFLLQANRPSAPTAAAAVPGQRVAHRLGQTRGYKQVRLGKDELPIPSPTARQPQIPAYPLGPRQVYKQSNMGLYGQARIRVGNTVSRETEIINPQKNRRKWRPNIQEKRLWSEALAAPIRSRVSTRVLRTIDKVGGLDEYLLGSKPARIAELGPWGWKLRWRIMQTPAVQDRFRQQRLALGLPEPPADADAAGVDAEAAAETTALQSTEATAETQQMIDAGEVFDLAPEQGFMHEEKKPSI